MLNSRTVRAVFKNVSLRDVLTRYCEGCWRDGWKPSKAKAIQNPENPFVGGPQDLLAKGILSVTTPDGGTIIITKLTRLRLRQLDAASLAAVGDAMGKDLVAIAQASASDKDAMGRDVVHQEWVGTFAENVANDYAHFFANAVSAVAVLDAVVSRVADSEITVEALAELLEATLAGKRADVASTLSLAARSAWLSRAVVQEDTGYSWKKSSDFVFEQNLPGDVSAIDTYVVKPVLEQFVADLRSGYFTK